MIMIIIFIIIALRVLKIKPLWLNMTFNTAATEIGLIKVQFLFFFVTYRHELPRGVQNRLGLQLV
jgi:hypothetical protein